MKPQKSPTPETSPLPQSAALKFVKRQTTNTDDKIVSLEPNSPTETVPELPPAETPIPAKPRRRTAGLTQNSISAVSVENVYEPFTTRVRRDIKRRLKRLSHDCEDRGHETHSLQDFVEQALLYWLAKQDEPERAE